MQTNRAYFESLTVTALKSILSDFNATGFSKMRKADLINFVLILMDGAHSDAIAYEAEQAAKMIESVEAMVSEAFPPSIAEIDAEYRLRKGLSSGRKSYTERMLNRTHGYYVQNGCTRLTARQRRRHDKKYNRQYGKLLATLSN